MKKTLIALSLFPVITFSSDFVNIIGRDASYIAEKIETPEPILDYTKQAWMNIDSSVIGSNLYPAVADGSSGEEYSTSYNFNFGQKPFLGDSYGFKPYDENYDSSKWIDCVVDSENYCAPPNSSSSKYNHGHSSGQFYFEFTLKGNPIGPHVEFMGMFDKTKALYYSGIGASRVGSVDGGGYHYTSGSGNNNAINKGYKYKSNGVTASGTTMQVWIDYDTMTIAIMELGTTKSDYENYTSR